jgi:hypothetical protein
MFFEFLKFHQKLRFGVDMKKVYKTPPWLPYFEILSRLKKIHTLHQILIFVVISKKVKQEIPFKYPAMDTLNAYHCLHKTIFVN